MKLEILIAQVIFGGIGLFFIGMAAVGVFYYRYNSYPSSGWSPVVGVFIGLPFIALVALLDGQHKKNNVQKIQQILMRCPACGHLNDDEAKFCNGCGTALKEHYVQKSN
jgi:hypothetical protein